MGSLSRVNMSYVKSNRIVNYNFCILDVDECLDDPCKNSGTCTNNAGSFVCSCKTGWQGITCEQGNLTVIKLTLLTNDILYVLRTIYTARLVVCDL